MPATVYRASLVAIILLNSRGQAIPLGIGEQFQISKQFETEALREIGNFFAPEILLHGVGATFSFQKAWVKNVDLVGQGIVPADATIAQYEPFTARLVDLESQRLICTVVQAVASAMDITTQARAKLLQGVNGIAVTALMESELA